MIILLILSFTIIGVMETATLSKNKYWRELVVFSVVHLTAFILCVLLSLGYELPSPAKGLELLLKSVFNLFAPAPPPLQ